MLHEVFLISLLASAAISARESDEATVKSASCLIQRERASSILQMARSSRLVETDLLTSAPAPLLSSKESEDVVGKELTIDFMPTSPDVHFMGIKTLPDFNDNEKNMTLIKKTYFELHHNHTDTDMGKVKIYGFKLQSSGLVNSNADRLWTDKPSKKNAKLVYGILVSKVPEARSWKYDISFAERTPKHLKIYPEGGKVHSNGSDIYITMECSHKQTCKDGSIKISKVTFTPENTTSKDRKVHAVDNVKLRTFAFHKVKNEMDFETIFGNASFGQIEKGSTEEERGNSSDRHKANRTKATVKKDFEAKFGNASFGQIEQGKVEEEEDSGIGESLTVDFTAENPDMATLGKRSVPDYIFDGQSINAIDKNYYELSLEDAFRGHGNISVDRVNLFGFEPRRGGLVNIAEDRLWTDQPTNKDAHLVYGIMLTNVPKDEHWKYAIKFAKPPPLELRVLPEDGMLARDGNNFYITLECVTEDVCKDESIEISKITFSVQKGPDVMQPPAALQVDRKDTDFGLMLGKALQVERKDTDLGLMFGRAFE